MERGHHPCQGFFSSLKQPQGLFYKCCKARTRACVALLECVSLLAVHYPFCCWINGAIDQRQTCVSQRTADHSPTARPDTGAPISTATARMITDAWLGRAAKRSHGRLPSPLTDLTLIGEGAAAGKLWIGSTRQKQTRNENAGVKLNRGAEGMLGGRQSLLSAVNIMMYTWRGITVDRIDWDKDRTVCINGVCWNGTWTQADSFHLLVFDGHMCPTIS